MRHIKILSSFAGFFIWCFLGYSNSMAENKLNSLVISSPAFGQNEGIPQKYTCQGQDVSPVLNITGIPNGTQSMVLIVDDPDAPGGNWDHWLVYNIPVIDKIPEGAIPGTQLINDFQKREYGGPCPPSGTHRYFFKLYAIDQALDLPATATKKDLLNSLSGHLLAKAELIGLYKKTFSFNK
jgi:Raf kinase inhibitor-like YbhB/YbcL family protein